MVDAQEVLQSVPLFRRMKPKEVKALARWTTTRTFDPGQVIVGEGQMGVGLYCIQSGAVKVSRRGPQNDIELREMGPGQTFGELSLLDDQPRSATVTATRPTTAILLDKSQFLAELRTHPEIGLAIIPTLVDWLREADARSASLS